MSVPVHQESATSAALDGARIAVFTAGVLVQMDCQLSDLQREGLLTCLGQAAEWLDGTRELLPVETTSVHVAPARSNIIVPDIIVPP